MELQSCPWRVSVGNPSAKWRDKDHQSNFLDTDGFKEKVWTNLYVIENFISIKVL